jgi:hypothetical protein
MLHILLIIFIVLIIIFIIFFKYQPQWIKHSASDIKDETINIGDKITHLFSKDIINSPIFQFIITIFIGLGYVYFCGKYFFQPIMYFSFGIILLGYFILYIYKDDRFLDFKGFLL